ncbi:FUN14 family-domain-containing protein [Sporodiniella umbellata]|nr:FUN14 family-domain-containing protein [Sporodiniella umbellata]
MLRLPRVYQFNIKAASRLSPTPRTQIVRQFNALTQPVKQNCKSTPIAIGASKILPLATLSTASLSLFARKPVQCEALHTIPTQVNRDAYSQSQTPLIRKGELTFGTFLGVCTGFLIKKVGKLFAAFVGTMFVFVQYLSGEGYVTVNWSRFENKYTKTLDMDGDGKVTTKDLQSRWKRVMAVLTNNIQFKSTFLVGFYVGLRYG